MLPNETPAKKRVKALRRKNPSETINAQFSCLDIENDKAGNVLAIGISWREAGSINHRVFPSWEDFWVWLLPQAQQSKIFRTIYAHNGGGWDWLSFLQWFVESKRHEGTSVGLVEAQSKLVFLDIGFVRTDKRTVKGDPVKRLSIRLCDSMYLLRSKLNDLAIKIVGQGKTETDIEEVWRCWREDKPRFYRYLESDCELLLLVLEKSLDLIREKIAKIPSLGMTIGSCAMNIFRTVWSQNLDRPIYTNLDPRIETLCREGYHGGRVEVFRHGYYPRIYVYDINSLYPSAMVSYPVPVSGRGAFTNRLRTNQPSVYRVKFTQHKRDVPPVLLSLGGAGSYEGVGVYYSPELQLLKEVDPNAEIVVDMGWVFSECSLVFGDFVHGLYGLRLADKDSAISLLAKFLLNSLYGKWAQRGEREKLIVFDSPEAAHAAEIEAATNGTKLTPTERDSLLYAESETVEVEHAHVGIAGMITSQARATLYRMILEAGSETVVYSDTDSIHTTENRLDKFIGPELGKLKLEACGEGVYCGKKLYAIREGEKVKIRAKGISVGKNGYDLKFEQLQSLLDGVKVKTEFARPATFRGVLAGAQSCKMDEVKRTRVIRKT